MKDREAVLITGAAGGMGVEIVTRLLRTPYSPIYAVDIDPLVLSKFSQHPNVIAIQADVRSKMQIDNVFKMIAASSTPLGVVIQLAGVIYAQAGARNIIWDTKWRQGLSLRRTNTDGPLYIMDKAAELMEKNGGGIIVNIASSKNYFPDSYRMDYMRSKFLLEQKSLEKAEMLRRRNIRVAIVKPGNTRTGIDRGTWIDGSNMDEAAAVQGLNEWWREHLSSSPSKVAEAVYKIVTGQTAKNVVHVGFDAHLGSVLSSVVPFFDKIFYKGAALVYGSVKMAARLRSKQLAVNVNYGDEDHLRGEWFREFRGEQVQSMRGGAVLVEDRGSKYNFHIFAYPYCSFDGSEESIPNAREVFDYLNRKAFELGNKTRLTTSCEPKPDGNWQYRYMTEQDPNSDEIYGYESVLFQGEEVYRSSSVFIPVP